MNRFFFIALLAVCTIAYADDMSTLRQRLTQSILPRDAAAQEQIVAEASRAAEKLNANSTWDDIDFSDKKRTYWSAEQHMDRVLLMARAYAINRDEKLLANANRALDYWLEHDYQNPNWWHNQIGIPQLVGQTFLLLQPQVTPKQTKKVIEILKRATWEKWTGQNLIWGVTIQICRGLIEDDTAAITQAFARMYDEVRITQSEGIQPDFSFHQHGDQLYSGGYGMGFANDVSRYIAFSWGTRWQIPDAKLAIFESYLLDGEQWMMHGSRFDYSAIGREITRKGKTAIPHSWTSGPISPVGAAYGMFNSMALLADEPVLRHDELERFVAHMRGETTAPLVGNRHFWNSDYMAHHAPGWFASVRMFSTRMQNTEVVNDEGKKSQHMADGCNLLYLAGDEYYDIFPVWDWLKIPGTTAEQTLDVEKGAHGGIGVHGKTSFVGGVSDGSFGLATMQLARGKLAARKAWFFFDTGYLCLGSGITDTRDIDVVTTINQSHLSGEVEKSDGWFRHANVGYLTGDAKVTLATNAQEGSWFDIGMGSDKKLSQNIFKLWIDHGQKPANATYAYVVLPGASLDETRSAAAKWPVRVIINTPALQVVTEETTKAVACAFAEKGTVDADGQTISVDQPCLLLIHNGKLTVSNPENKPLTVNVRINDKTFRVDLPDGPAAGSSISVPLNQ